MTAFQLQFALLSLQGDETVKECSPILWVKLQNRLNCEVDWTCVIRMLDYELTTTLPVPLLLLYFMNYLEFVFYQQLVFLILFHFNIILNHIFFTTFIYALFHVKLLNNHTRKNSHKIPRSNCNCRLSPWTKWKNIFRGEDVPYKTTPQSMIR